MPVALGLLACLTLTAPVADGLRAKLDAGQPVSIYFNGDSVTQGMHLEAPQRDAFPALVTQMLKETWPKTPFTVTVNGIPGASTSDALIGFDTDVKPHQPDLILLQYGGNDKGVGDGLDTLEAYRLNLTTLTQQCQELGSAVLLLVPPMKELALDTPYPKAAREVATACDVAFVDLDGVLKVEPRDYRGLFPYFFHPGQYDHARAAQAIYQAILQLIGRPSQLTATLEPAVFHNAALGKPVYLPFSLTRTDDLTADLAIQCRGASGPVKLEDGEGAERHGTIGLGLPHTLPGGRSTDWPLWLQARAGSSNSFSVARATVVPSLNCPLADTPPAALPMVVLGAPHLSVGRGFWSGADDLRAGVWLARDDEAVYLRVDVEDDRVVTSPGVPNTDGIELYLDLRDDAQRGLPFYSSECATLFISAPAKGEEAVITTANEDATPEALLALKPDYRLTTTGYRIDLTLPRRVLNQIAGRAVKAFGLDLAVDDSDRGSYRESQLLWLGRPDNYVNPRRLGEIRLDGKARPAGVRVTVF